MLLCCQFVWIVCGASLALGAQAQTGPPPAQAGAGAEPGSAAAQNGAGTGSLLSKAVLQLFDDLDDIDRLRSLGPLKLTADQLDKMIAALTAAKELYDRNTADLALAQVKKLEADIKDVKRKMLAGGTIPTDFDTKAQKASAVFVAAREKLDTDNLAKLADVFREIFTPTQIAEAVKLSKAAPAAATLQPNAASNLWFNYYVKEIIIGYPRILPLLKEMRSAAGADTKTAKAG